MRKTRKGWRLLLILLVAAAAVVAVSCATKPAPVEEPAPAVEPAPTPAPEPAPAPEVPKPDAEYQAAKALRATVTQFELAHYDQASFDAAEASFQDGEGAYGKDNTKAKADFEQAIAGYQKVLDGGFPALIAERKAAADDAKAIADMLKASVAVKADYSAGLNAYNQAMKANQAKDYAKCVGLFNQAEAKFTAAADRARQLKAQAENSMDAVQAQLTEAEQKAAEAEKVKEEGGL
jgi:hypothetical protein